MDKQKLENWLDENVYGSEDYQGLAQSLSITEDPLKWLRDNESIASQYPGFDSIYEEYTPVKERLVKKLNGKDWDSMAARRKYEIAKSMNLSEDLLNKAWSEYVAEQANKKKSKEEIEAEKLAQQYRYDRQKAVDGYTHSYLGMDKDNILNKGLNLLADLVISDDTKRAIVENPDNTAGIAGNFAADYLGTTADFLPGYGQLAGPAIRIGRDVVVGKDLDDIVRQNAADVATAGMGAKFAKGLKIKGVSDDAVDVGGKVADAATSSKAGEAVKSFNKGVELAKDPDLLLYTSKFNIDQMKAIEKMDPMQWANYVESFSDKPRVYNMLKSIEYENRDKVLDKIKDIAKNQQKFNENQLAAAALYKKNNPKKFKTAQVIEKATPAVKEGLNKASHIATRKGTQETPYKTSDPSKMKAEKKQDVLDWYKEQYGPQWDMGFKPRPINGDLMMEAYRQWYDERH